MAKKSWQDIGSVKGRQAGRAAQLARDAAYRAAHNTAIIKDGQTLEDIAKANDTRVEDILAANQHMAAPKTGMVINLPVGAATLTPDAASYRVPNPTAAQERGYEYRPGGLPSNAALGGATTNPLGRTSRTGYSTLGASFPVPHLPGSDFVSNLLTLKNSPQLWSPVQTGVLGAFGQALNNAQQSVLGSTNTSAPAVTQKVTIPSPQFNTFFDANPEVRQALQATYNKVMTSNNYTPEEIKFLEYHGWIEKAPTPTASGGYGGYNRYRRGGGGGGGGTKATPQPAEPRAPAFSSGQSSFGLVNWRI
jgi:hypothetical protein